MLSTALSWSLLQFSNFISYKLNFPFLKWRATTNRKHIPVFPMIPKMWLTHFIKQIKQDRCFVEQCYSQWKMPHREETSHFWFPLKLESSRRTPRDPREPDSSSKKKIVYSYFRISHVSCIIIIVILCESRIRGRNCELGHFVSSAWTELWLFLLLWKHRPLNLGLED